MARSCNFCGNIVNDGDVFCKACGGNLGGTTQMDGTTTPVDTFQQQPQYSQPIIQPAQPTAKEQGSMYGQSIASFALSLVGFLLFGGIIFGSIAVALGGSALNHYKTFPGDKGKGLAIAGIVIGIIDIVAVVASMVIGK